MAGQFLIEVWIEPNKYRVRATQSADFVSLNSLLAFLRKEIKTIEAKRTEDTDA